MRKSGISTARHTGQGLFQSIDLRALHGPTVTLLALLAILGSLIGSWLLVYYTGGTSKAFPHVFYVPVLLGAWFFGFPGGILAAFAAGFLCGPLMPFDTSPRRRAAIAPCHIKAR